MKEADVPVRSIITTGQFPTNGDEMQDLARSLTAYAALRWFEPYSFEWNDPDHRWVDLVDYAAKPVCEYERCGRPFEPRAYNHRFCSKRCRRNAADLRLMARPVTVDPQEVRREMEAALANIRALVGEEAA